MFDRKSHILVEQDKASEDELMTAVARSRAPTTFATTADQWEVISPPEQHDAVCGGARESRHPYGYCRDRHDSRRTW